MFSDDIESRTLGGFQHTKNALFIFSTRLALKNTEAIRKYYPNFLMLFKSK